jgi:hypothetical protein
MGNHENQLWDESKGPKSGENGEDNLNDFHAACLIF